MRAGANRPVIGERLRDPRMLARISSVEARIRHAEGIEQHLLQGLVKRCAGHDLNHTSKYIGRLAIVPRSPWMIGEGQLRQPFNERFCRGVAFVEVCFTLKFLDGAFAEEAIGKPGTVSHKVLDRHRALRCDEFKCNLVFRILLFFSDLHFLERR